MPMNAQKSNFKEADFLKFAESVGLNERYYKRAAARFAKRLPAMLDLVERSFLPEEARYQYRELIAVRAARLKILPDEV